jgi:hypothetical protein
MRRFDLFMQVGFQNRQSSSLYSNSLIPTLFKPIFSTHATVMSLKENFRKNILKIRLLLVSGLWHYKSLDQFLYFLQTQAMDSDL